MSSFRRKRATLLYRDICRGVTARVPLPSSSAAAPLPNDCQRKSSEEFVTEKMARVTRGPNHGFKKKLNRTFADIPSTSLVPVENSPSCSSHESYPPAGHSLSNSPTGKTQDSPSSSSIPCVSSGEDLEEMQNEFLCFLNEGMDPNISLDDLYEEVWELIKQ